MGEYGVVVSSMTSCSTWNQIPDTDFTRKLFQCLQETPDAIAFVSSSWSVILFGSLNSVVLHLDNVISNFNSQSFTPILKLIIIHKLNRIPTKYKSNDAQLAESQP